MDTSTAILQVAVIPSFARLLGELANRLQVPTVIGEIHAGVVIGPSLPGFVAAEGLVWVLAKFGIILLPFQIGLWTDIGELLDSGAESVVVAVAPTLAKSVSYLVRHWERSSEIPRLVFAELGRYTGVFNAEIYATTVIVIACTTPFTPCWLRLYYRVFGRFVDGWSGYRPGAY